MEELFSSPAASHQCRAALVATAVAVTCTSAFADFGVSPVLLEFDRNTRTGSIAISNGDPAKPLQVQMDALSWTQDGEGKDHYEKTQELTFLPRIMTVQPADQRLLRAGIRVPAADREKAYRLFIEEIPEPRQEGATGTSQVAIKVRFAIPVFAKPLKEEPAGEIANLDMTKGTVKVDVRNTGNVHFVIQSVRVTAGELFSKELSGWYLLPGATRSHTVEIPAQACEQVRELDVTVKTDRLELKRSLTLNKPACR